MQYNHHQTLRLLRGSVCFLLLCAVLAGCQKSKPDIKVLLGKPRQEIEKVCGLPKSTVETKATDPAGKPVTLQTCSYETPLNMYPVSVTYSGNTFQYLTVMIDFPADQYSQAIHVIGIRPEGEYKPDANGKLSPLPELGDFTAYWHPEDNMHNSPHRLTIFAAGAAKPISGVASH
jgi:hypothetical protein